MTRLIDEDAIPWDVEGVGEIPVITKEEIDQMPTVDAVPVRHGKWEYGENESGYDGYSCSKCDGHVKWNYAHENIDFIPQYYRYCPYCGARMDEE